MAEVVIKMLETEEEDNLKLFSVVLEEKIYARSSYEAALRAFRKLNQPPDHVELVFGVEPAGGEGPRDEVTLTYNRTYD